MLLCHTIDRQQLQLHNHTTIMGIFDEIIRIVPKDKCFDILENSLNKATQRLIAMRNGHYIEPQIGKGTYITLFVDGLKNTINSNDNIPKKDIDDLMSFLLNKTVDNPQSSEKSFLSADPKFSCLVLDIITKKCKIEKADIKIISSFFAKEYFLHAHCWIDNLIQLGCEIGKSEMKIFNKNGFDEILIKFINRYDQQMEIPQNFINIFIREELLLKVISEGNFKRNIIKNLQNNGFLLTRDYFDIVLDKYINDSNSLYVEDDMETMFIIQLLDFFSSCGYVFTEYELCQLLFVDKSLDSVTKHAFNNSITWMTKKAKIVGYSNKEILISIVNFFANKKVYLTFDFVYKSYCDIVFFQYNSCDGFLDGRDKMEHLFYGFFARLYILLENNLVRHNESTDSERNLKIIKNISLMPSKFEEKYYKINGLNLTKETLNKTSLRKYYPIPDDIKLDTVIAKLAVVTNDEYLLEILIKDYPTILTKVTNGLRFACINLNESLVDFYLNNKFEPTQYHVLCAFKSVLYQQDQNLSSKLETMYNILVKLSMFGLKITEDVYQIISMYKKLDESKIDQLLSNISTDKRKEIKKNSKSTKNISIHIPAKKEAKATNKGKEKIEVDLTESVPYMFKLCNLQTLIILCERLKILPTIECLDNALELNYYPNVLEYFADEINYVPTQKAIDNSANNAIKAIMEYRIKHFKYDDRDNIKLFEVVPVGDVISTVSNDMINTNKIDQPHQTNFKKDLLIKGVDEKNIQKIIDLLKSSSDSIEIVNSSAPNDEADELPKKIKKLKSKKQKDKKIMSGLIYAN